MSTTTTPFRAYTSDDAPEGSRSRVAAAERSFGFLPAPVSLMAESPELLEGFLAINAIFNKCSLGQLQREVLILTIATRVSCHYCVAMHSAMLTKSGTDPHVIEALRNSAELADPSLEALRRFTLHVMDTDGAASDDELALFLESGFTTRSALDVVLGLGTYRLSTAANRMTRAELDLPFQPFEWHDHG